MKFQNALLIVLKKEVNVMITCHHIEIKSMKAITSSANVLSTAQIIVSPMYIARNTPRGAK